MSTIEHDAGLRRQAAEDAVAAKLTEAGLDGLRPRHSFDREPEAPAEPAAEAAPEETPAELESQAESQAEPQPAERQGDPVAAAVLAKYGNDPSKLAEAYASLERRLGEQRNEIGQTRQENAELAQLLAEVGEIKQQLTHQPQLPSQGTVEWIDEQIAANPQAARDLAVRALNDGQTLLAERIMRTWYDHDAYAAQEFSNTLRFEQMKRELAQQQPARDESTQMQAALSQVLAEHPEFTQYTDGLDAVINRYPAAAAGLRGSQQEKQQAIETLFALAERDTLRAVALSGGPAAEPATEQQVASSTTSQEHPHEAPAAPTPEEVFREQFRQEAARHRGERAIPQAFVAR